VTGELVERPLVVLVLVDAREVALWAKAGELRRVQARRDGETLPRSFVEHADALAALRRSLAAARVGADSSRAQPGGSACVPIAVPMPGTDATMSSMQVAEVLKCTDRAVRKAADSGRLPGRIVGTRWKFDRADVDAYKAQRASS
jgi:excisionase family DNA binding protein